MNRVDLVGGGTVTRLFQQIPLRFVNTNIVCIEM